MHLRTYSALEWDQRYSGTFFLDRQIAYRASLSHPRTWTLVYILASEKKEKLKEENRKEIRKGKNKIYKGILATGGKIHSQSWKMMCF